MTDRSVTTTEQIPGETWEDWFDVFTLGHAGRVISIDVVDEETVVMPLAEDVRLVAIDYDTVSKGNDFVISFGEPSALTSHVIDAPIALWRTQNSSGDVVSLEIAAEDGQHTIVKFR
jgi:hypothetical protein